MENEKKDIVPDLTQSCKNLFYALNKANKAGIFDLNESSQIAHDLNFISEFINQFITTKEKKQVN